MAFVVVFDADVLYPIGLCDLFITTLKSRLYRAYWSTSILEEVERTYVRNFPDKPPENIQRRIKLMNEAEPGALIDPPPELIEAMTNDPKGSTRPGDRSDNRSRGARHVQSVGLSCRIM